MSLYANNAVDGRVTQLSVASAPEYTIMIIAGEASGDIHGANLVQAMKQEMPHVSFFGTGGEHMKAAGVQLMYDLSELAVLGLVEVLKKLMTFRRIFRHLVTLLSQERPDAVILIDYPGFNIRFAQRAKLLGIPVHYYISPQLWAWLPSRIKKIKKSVDSMTVIFKFEKDFYTSYGMSVDFFGHPLVDALEAPFSRDTALSRLGLAVSDTVIGLFPGSRKQEVLRILPAMLETAKLIREKDSRIKVAISIAHDMVKPVIQQCVQASGIQDILFIERDRHYALVNACSLALVASGTITLEMAFYTVPCIIMYRVSFITWLIGRFLIRVPALGLVNLLSEKPFIPEFIQHAIKPRVIAQEVWCLLQDTERTDTMRRNLAIVKQGLGEKGASVKAAHALLERIYSK